MFEDQKPVSRMALKIGIAGFIGFGAIATGMFVTRKGRHLVKEAWQGRERTRIEDRVLDALWDDPSLSRREIDVDELEDGHVELVGLVRSDDERVAAVRIASAVKGVSVVIDRLEVAVRPKKRRRLRSREL
ncbi:MAG TPA: BON domain-containing protein [Longimicrobiales bacterium]|nr:BON domain-containing protein [Longimicrobiales bacterium]